MVEEGHYWHGFLDSVLRRGSTAAEEERGEPVLFLLLFDAMMMLGIEK